MSVKINAGACILCGACSAVCPVNAIEVSVTEVCILNDCTECGLCAKVCPMGAIVVERKV